MTVEVTMEVREDGGIEVLSPFHWWCRDCGRWEVCDDADRCRECAWMRRRPGVVTRGRPPRHRVLAGAAATAQPSGATGARAGDARPR